MIFPPFWFLEADVYIDYEFGERLIEDEGLGVQNWEALFEAEADLFDATGDADGPWPSGYTVPAAALPEDDFSPDFWMFGRSVFASRRLRDALAQPGDVVQFVPFELVRASPQARAQDYQWMRVTAGQPALDLARCECRIEERRNAITGAPGVYLSNIDFLALREDLVARSEIFRIEESRTDLLVTDALAARVLRAGCTGMEFRDPSNRWSGKRVERLRTADGIAERRVGFLD